ncbi:MAG: hypothetical protein ISR45_12415 [Rhodospirillales bacterium]|nr:hypothetical protein [Rhodospirillales bacterium]
MQTNGSHKLPLAATLGVVWCLAVVVSYFAFNLPYYSEKISTFGRFFQHMTGL